MSALSTAAPEVTLGKNEFARIADMLLADSGIHLASGKAALVHGRLIKRLRAHGMTRFSEYCALVASPGGADERREMLAALTTNVTAFFREPHHFDDLRRKVLPPLLERARRGDRVRIWSAASSSGQEPYSIALTILELLPDAADLDVRILATDIDPNMVSATKAALYEDDTLAAVPKAMRLRWFQRQSEAAPSGQSMYRAAEAMRRLVVPRELNLVGHWPMSARYQAVFCRNVVIYFEASTQARIWARMLPYLEPNATLYIGHSERVAGDAAKLLVIDGVTTYRLSDGASA